MFDFTDVQIENLVIHKVGNKMRDEEYVLSKHEYLNLDENLRGLLLKYFLSPFKSDIFYRFNHETDINLNEVYHYINNTMDNHSSFYDQSVNILKHLYNKSSHPRIKGGEFYMVALKNCIVNNQLTNAVGLFKSENKDTYLKVTQNQSSIVVDYEYGININNLDKGCIIFNIQNSEGYLVSIVDTSSTIEAQYWKKDFLGLSLINNEHLQTKTHLKIITDFSNRYLSEDKQENAALKQRTLKYFSENEYFDINNFSDQVFKDNQLVDSFIEYKENRIEKLGVQNESKFPISSQIVTQVKKQFKNIISLDNNVDIVVKSETERDISRFIERGFDEDKGLSYYKIFFHTEK
ncbi:UNVERIFIED_CONTAM: hypothetical protein ABIC26_004254 [Paenibacillus sp. PvR008]